MRSEGSWIAPNSPPVALGRVSRLNRGDTATGALGLSLSTDSVENGSDSRVMPSPEYRSNWIWLSDLRVLDRVLLQGSADTDLVRCLAHQFRDVVVVVPDVESTTALKQAVVAQGSNNVHLICAALSNLPLANECFNGVVIRLQGDGARRRDYHSVLGVIAHECGRVLEREGWLFVLWLQARWYRGILGHLVVARRRLGGSWKGLGRSPLVRYCPRPVIMKAGFRTIRPYYIIPSLTDPKEVIPARRRALLAISVGFARRVLIRLGLHGLLFSTRLLIARK